MPSRKMVARSTTTCKRHGRFPRVSRKSNKISKRPCTMVRITDEMRNLDISSQTSHNGGYFLNKEFSEERGNEEHQMSSDVDSVLGQGCLLFSGCSVSVVERDSFLVSVSASSDSDTALSNFNRPDDALYNLFEEVNQLQITTPPQVDNNNFPNFQTPDMLLDSYMDEACLNGFPSDGTNLFDDSIDYSSLFDLEYDGPNLLYGLPALENTIEPANFHYVESSEEFQPAPDSSWFDFICHQAKPLTEELHARSSQLDSERVESIDHETFIKNFLELSDECNSLPALVSKETSKRKDVTLVLDLDETLIHSTMTRYDSGADFTIQVLLDKEYTVYVRKRPFLREFLERVSEMFEIIIFTASKKIYAEKLLDVLDPDKKFFSRREYRDSCIYEDGTYTKDLTVLGIDLAKVAIVDNSPQVFRLQVNNGIPIESWFDDPSDSALMSLLPFLEKLVDVDDVRPIIAEKFGNKKD